MNLRSRFLFLVLMLSPGLSLGLSSQPAIAQRGSLIEDLFRTVTEAQLQKERQRQAERNKAKPKPVPPPSRRPKQMEPVGQIRVGSREMATVAEALSGFTREIGFLISDMQPYVGRHPEIRPILPAVYQVSSQADALLRACDGLSRFDPIADQFAKFDSRWRTLSFQLRSSASLTPEMQSHVRACDRFISKMGNQMGIAPQMDRHGLHDQMIIAATYMQALLDDLQVSGISPRKVHMWAHDGRLLRQELLRTADEVDSISYEEITTRFSDFIARWRQFSVPIAEQGNPHFNQRLDRIAQCGEETYALLWMRPPTSTQDLTATVASLKEASSELMDQLTLRALASLDRTSRDRIEQGTRAMYDEVKHLEDSLRSGADSSELREHFVEYDQAWLTVKNIASKINRVNGGLIDKLDRHCQTMRRVLRVQSSGPAPVQMEELIGIAASLEGSAEYFKADIKRYEQYLSPAGFRRSILNAADDFHDASRGLHAQLFDRADLRSVSREADRVVDAWQRLSGDVAQLRSHGLSGRRAANLENASRNLAPLVAKVGAALLQ